MSEELSAAKAYQELKQEAMLEWMNDMWAQAAKQEDPAHALYPEPEWGVEGILHEELAKDDWSTMFAGASEAPPHWLFDPEAAALDAAATVGQTNLDALVAQLDELDREGKRDTEAYARIYSQYMRERSAYFGYLASGDAAAAGAGAADFEQNLFSDHGSWDPNYQTTPKLSAVSSEQLMTAKGYFTAMQKQFSPGATSQTVAGKGGAFSPLGSLFEAAAYHPGVYQHQYAGYEFLAQQQGAGAGAAAGTKGGTFGAAAAGKGAAYYGNVAGGSSYQHAAAAYGTNPNALKGGSSAYVAAGKHGGKGAGTGSAKKGGKMNKHNLAAASDPGAAAYLEQYQNAMHDYGYAGHQYMGAPAGGFPIFGSAAGAGKDVAGTTSSAGNHAAAGGAGGAGGKGGGGYLGGGKGVAGTSKGGGKPAWLSYLALARYMTKGKGKNGKKGKKGFRHYLAAAAAAYYADKGEGLGGKDAGEKGKWKAAGGGKGKALADTATSKITAKRCENCDEAEVAADGTTALDNITKECRESHSEDRQEDPVHPPTKTSVPKSSAADSGQHEDPASDEGGAATTSTSSAKKTSSAFMRGNRMINNTASEDTEATAYADDILGSCSVTDGKHVDSEDDLFLFDDVERGEYKSAGLFDHVHGVSDGLAMKWNVEGLESPIHAVENLSANVRSAGDEIDMNVVTRGAGGATDGEVDDVTGTCGAPLMDDGPATSGATVAEEQGPSNGLEAQTVGAAM
eukprot:g15886.t1